MAVKGCHRCQPADAPTSNFPLDAADRRGLSMPLAMFTEQVYILTH